MRAFLACQTQWRISEMSGRLRGLDYGGCRAAIDGAGLNWHEVFPGLRFMEMCALEADD